MASKQSRSATPLMLQAFTVGTLSAAVSHPAFRYVTNTTLRAEKCFQGRVVVAAAWMRSVPHPRFFNFRISKNVPASGSHYLGAAGRLKFFYLVVRVKMGHRLLPSSQISCNTVITSKFPPALSQKYESRPKNLFWFHWETSFTQRDESAPVLWQKRFFLPISKRRGLCRHVLFPLPCLRTHAHLAFSL